MVFSNGTRLNMQYDLNLRDVVYALSHALDFVGVDDTYHGKRVAMMSMDCASVMKWPEQINDVILPAGLLHDCGVSTTQEHKFLINELEWSESGAHAVRGYQYLSEIPELSHLAPIVLYHHTRWEDLKDLEVDEEIKVLSNLIFLTDRLDALRAQEIMEGKNILQIKDDVLSILRKYSGTLFKPELLEALHEAAAQEAFWFSLESEIVAVKMDLFHEIAQPISIDFKSLHRIADMFSRIIDAKSPHTEDHSRGVARLSRLLGTRLNLDEDTCNLLEIAGLLHDLGKLRIPDSILDKPGALTVEERFQITRHSYDTYQILKSVFPNTRIPEWAAFHHESISGNGYPFHKKGSEISLEARIVAVADTYQALAQNRPYRESLDHEQIMEILQDRVRAGALDPLVVENINTDPIITHRIATGTPNNEKN